MKRFNVTGWVSVPVYTIVEAEDALQAEEIAAERGIPNLCAHCAGSWSRHDPHLDWKFGGDVGDQVEDIEVSDDEDGAA